MALIDISKLSTFILYTVEVKASNVFNKRYKLIYGKCLRKLLEANNEHICCYKIPSFIHKVNYDQIVNELWETDLTKDDKKNIGHITFGMLEITQHRTEELRFHTLREACHCQTRNRKKRRSNHAIRITS